VAECEAPEASVQLSWTWSPTWWVARVEESWSLVEMEVPSIEVTTSPAARPADEAGEPFRTPEIGAPETWEAPPSDSLPYPLPYPPEDPLPSEPELESAWLEATSTPRKAG
jgi:hypothetical protein